MKNLYLACSEAFNVQLKNNEFSKLLGNKLRKGQFYLVVVYSLKRRLPISRSLLNNEMGDTLPFWKVWFRSVMFESNNRRTHSPGRTKTPAIWDKAKRRWQRVPAQIMIR